MSRKRKRQLLNIVVVLAVIVLILQLQPFIVQARGGADGTFGFRPMTQDCLGLVADAAGISYLPFGEFQFQLGYFKFMYSFTLDDFDKALPMCVGQDIWYGE